MAAMMATKRQRDEVEGLSQEERAALRLHVRQLKLAGTDEYRAWCAERKLASKLVKPEHQRRKEVELRQNEELRKAMARSRTARKDPRQMLELIFAGTVDPADLPPHYQASRATGRVFRQEESGRIDRSVP